VEKVGVEKAGVESVKRGGVERGRVERFDQEVGLGEVRAGDGRLLAFHCTEIAGGSRQIALGTEVTFEVAPGHLGIWEAHSVTPL
jgi:cold shock CspA family protein